MKNNEIIQITALVALAGALIYRKYWKKNKTPEKKESKSFFSSQSSDNDYEPYSKKKSAK
jgi:hypothetical protein